MELEYSVYRSVFTGLYYTTLLGGEFSNCHGQGESAEGAVISLKIRVNQLRHKKMKTINLVPKTPLEIFLEMCKCCIAYRYSFNHLKSRYPRYISKAGLSMSEAERLYNLENAKANPNRNTPQFND